MKKIMVIGSGPGLALGVVKRFGREGWRVVMLARNAERLEGEVKDLKEHGIDAKYYFCDVTDAEKLDRLVRQESEDGGIDVLNNNASPFRHGSLTEIPLDAIQKDVMMGYGSSAVSARAAIPYMKVRGTGSLIFSGGNTGALPWYLRPLGGANKAAVRNLAGGLTNDPAAKGLRIAYVNIDAHVIGQAIPDIAEIYWKIHNDPEPPATWDMIYSDGGDHSYVLPPADET
jgi:NAD(P)-dependent dehydrogenase (short-subunit alcohol dehydrogenase family)